MWTPFGRQTPSLSRLDSSRTPRFRGAWTPRTPVLPQALVPQLLRAHARLKTIPKCRCWGDKFGSYIRRCIPSIPWPPRQWSGCRDCGDQIALRLGSISRADQRSVANRETWWITSTGRRLSRNLRPTITLSKGFGMDRNLNEPHELNRTADLNISSPWGSRRGRLRARRWRLWTAPASGQAGPGRPAR